MTVFIYIVAVVLLAESRFLDYKLFICQKYFVTPRLTLYLVVSKNL